MWHNFSLLFSPSHSHSISDLDFNAEKEKEGTFWCFTVKHDGPTSVAGNLIIASHNRCKKTGVIAPVCLLVESWDFPRASHRATQNILQPHWQEGTHLVIIIILQCLWNICFSPPIYGHLGKSKKLVKSGQPPPPPKRSYGISMSNVKCQSQMSWQWHINVKCQGLWKSNVIY